MHFTNAASAALLSSVAFAKPLTAPGSNLKFSVNQVLDTNAVPLSPQQQMLKTYAKYGAPLPPKLKIAAKASQKFEQSGSVVATPQSYDLAYLSPVSVGGQTFNLNFDTGSADLWVFSTQQPASQTDGRAMYDPSKSKNATLLKGQQWAITYGDGSGASGDVFADTVVIGGVTATAQAVEAATSVSQQFLQDTQSGGLVGLAFSNLNTVRPSQQLTFFDNVRNSLAKPVFTANLKKGAPGSYDFGYVDKSKYSGAITWAPVQSSTGFWQFAMGQSQIGNKPRSAQSMGNAIADTGTTLIYLPDATVSAYWAAVAGASYNAQFGAYIFPCAAALPTFTIYIQGVPFVIPGNYMNYAPISNTMCFGGMQSNAGIGFSILGDVFLKSVFAVFDQTQGAARLGFAKQSDGTTPGSDPISDGDLPLLVVTTTTSAITATTPPTTSAPVPTTTASEIVPVVIASIPTSDAPAITSKTYETTISSLDFMSFHTSSYTLPTDERTVAPLAAASPVPFSKSLSAEPLIATLSSDAAADASTSGTSTSNQAAAKTSAAPTTTTTTTTTTAVRKPTTTRRVTTTTRRPTTTARKVSKVVCNARYIAAVKKAYPRKPKQFCRNYKPAAGVKRSIVKGVPNAAALKRVCACMVQNM